MKQDQQRNEAVRRIAAMLRRTPFTFEYRVKKKPKGVRVVCEVTQEQMDSMIARAAENRESVNSHY